MAFIVETGSGVVGANSYLSESEFEEYLESVGKTAPVGVNVETALVRASAWIDWKFGRRFTGVRLKGRLQGRAWPRLYAVDRYDHVIADDIVPVEIKEATAEAALREMASLGSLAPDMTQADSFPVKRERLGSIETEYAVPSWASSGPVYSQIEGLLGPLLVGSAGSLSLVRA